jgi:phage/plasmid-associated DNA primase
MTEKASGRDSANSALVQSRGKRYLQSNEPETDDKENMTLKASCVKSLTGSENIRVRELYGKSVEFPPNFTPHILLNGTIKINDTGYAMQRRIKVIFYPITFVDKNMLEYERQSYNNRQEEIKEELETLQGDLSDKQLLNKQLLLDELKKPFLFSLKDPSLEDKLINDKSFLNGFLYYMMDWFRKTNGTFISNEENNKATEDYFNENNPLNDWVKGYTAIDPKKPENKSKFIRSQVLHKEFMGNFMIEMGIKKFNENLKNFKYITCVDDTSNGMKVWLVKKKADDVE